MFRRLIAFTIGFALLAVSTRASVVVPTAFREVVADATLIVRGHLTDVRGVVMPENGVETIGTIAVDRVLKGTAGTFVTMTVPGGVVGRYRTVVSGAPRLTLGQQAVFLLKRRADGLWQPVGLTMGIYTIQTNTRSGRSVVDPPLVVGVTASTGPVVRGDSRRQLMTVQDFESLIQTVMVAATAGPKGGR